MSECQLATSSKGRKTVWLQYGYPWKNYCLLTTLIWAPSFRFQWLFDIGLHLWATSSSVALQPGVGLGLLYNTPPSLSIPCSIWPFVYSYLSKACGHVIQPPHFWSCSSSCCIQLSVHLFWNCGVLHSFCMTKPPYSLAFNEPDSVLPLWATYETLN